MKNIFAKNANKGFSLVEVVIASAIISIITFSIVSAAQKGLVLSLRALHQTQASYLLEEGAEAVKNVRDTSWSSISALTVGTTYYLSFNTTSNIWSLSTTANKVDNFFTRTVLVSSVYRDANDDIATSGVIDTYTKKVDINVSWLSDGGTVSKSLSFYITNIFS